MNYIKSIAYYLAVPALLAIVSTTHDPFSEAFTKLYVWVVLLLTFAVWLSLFIVWLAHSVSDIKPANAMGNDIPVLPLSLGIVYTLGVAAWIMTLGWNFTAFAYILAAFGLRAAKFVWNNLIVSKGGE